MTAYLGKANCAEPDHRREQGSDDCSDQHCVHCHGSASVMGVCHARCPGQKADDDEFDKMVAGLRKKVAGAPRPQ